VLRFVLAFCAMMIAGSANAETLTPKAFTDAFAAAATAAIPSAKVTISGELELEVRSAAGKATTSDLRNAYVVYKRDPAQRDAVIHRYVDVLAETLKVGEKRTLDRSRIVPVMKSVKWLEGVKQMPNGTGPPIEPLTEPFNSELTIVYAEDGDKAVRFLTTRDDVGDRSKLHDLALANLHRLLPKIEMRGPANGLWLIEAGGQYESSLLLADSIWSSGQFEVDGDIVVAVPVKNAVFVTGSNNHAGLARLRALAAELANGPYGLTPQLLVYRNGKFVVFDGK
jgi:uncharacterized protein YtpQ (UPF0354 family)